MNISSAILGYVTVSIDHSDIQDSYSQRFRVDSSEIPDNGVSHWSMNNGNDDVSILVDEWSGYDGSPAQGQATFISDGGQRGDGAFEFDGSDDGFEIPSTSIPDGNDSFSTHVEFSTDDASISYPNGGQGLFGRNGIFGTGMVVQNGLLKATADNRDAKVTHSISSNTDYTATMVLNASNNQLKLYVNGSFEGSD